MTKIVFGIMSAHQKPETVAQLISTLGDATVVVHHDFHQRPDFVLDDPRVKFVPEPAHTGWGTWGYCEGITRTLEFCLEHVDFDYFQLLSPTCLPIRRYEEFRDYVANSGVDGNMDLAALDSDLDLMMTFGWRFVGPRDSMRLRLLRRARALHFGPGSTRQRRTGLSILTRPGSAEADSALPGVLTTLTRAGLRGWFGSNPFSESFRPFVGSCWFGARRPLCEEIVRSARDPKIQAFFSKLPNADEGFLATAVGNSKFLVGPSNHFISDFNDSGNPHWLRPGQLPRVFESQAYFGRKFPDDPRAQIRLELIDRLRASEPQPRSEPAARSEPLLRGEPQLRSEAQQRVTPMVPIATARRAPRIAFGVMSAVAKVESVAQLTQSLAPHKVVIHHDYSQQPDFRINQPHVSFVPNPRRTGYGSWVWPAGILHLLRYCVDHVDFEYFQLMSPSCLPIRPVSEFADFIAGSEVDAHAEFMDLTERDVMMTYGHRALAPEKSLRRTALRRARAWYFGDDALPVERAGLSILTPNLAAAGGSLNYRAQAGLVLTRMINMAPFAVPPPEGRAKLFIGGPWFGATREVCEHMVKVASDPEWLRYFLTVNDIGELVFATILANSAYRIGPFNHYISKYQDWHPRWLGVEDLDTLYATKRFFARKFPDDASAPVRTLALEHVTESRPLEEAHS